MKKHYSISITIFNHNFAQNRAISLIFDENLNVIEKVTMEYHEGMKALRELEKKLGKTAKMSVNRYNPTICYKELHGWIEE